MPPGVTAERGSGGDGSFAQAASRQLDDAGHAGRFAHPSAPELEPGLHPRGDVAAGGVEQGDQVRRPRRHHPPGEADPGRDEHVDQVGDDEPQAVPAAARTSRLRASPARALSTTSLPVMVAAREWSTWPGRRRCGRPPPA